MATQKKKPQAKTDDKPKYRLGQKVFFTDYNTNKPKIMEGKVIKVTTTSELLPEGINSTAAHETYYIYTINTRRSLFDIGQNYVHPSFQSAAIEHGKTIFESL